MDCTRGNPRAVVGLLFRADCRCRPPDHRSSSRQRRRHAHRRARDLGHSYSSTVVRRRRLTASGPLGVRVGRSAALRGPSEPAGVLQGTPGNQNSARQTPFLSVADRARSAAPASAWTALEATCVQSSGCCSEPTAAAGRRTTGRGRGSGGGMRTIAPTISAFGPLHGRQAPPPGRQRAARRQSRPLSGPQRPFQTCGGTSSTPENQNSARQRRSQRYTRTAGPARFATPAPGTSNNNPTPALRRRRGTLRHITASLTQIRAPSMQFPQPSWCTQAPPNRPPRDTLAGTPLPAPNSLCTHRQIDSKRPPRCTHCHRIGPLPGGSFPEWVACHRNTQPLTTRRRLGLIHISTAPRHPLPAPLPLYRRRFI